MIKKVKRLMRKPIINYSLIKIINIIIKLLIIIKKRYNI